MRSAILCDFCEQLVSIRNATAVGNIFSREETWHARSCGHVSCLVDLLWGCLEKLDWKKLFIWKRLGSADVVHRL